jgi:ABC-2 type transport system ATP-binding protein
MIECRDLTKKYGELFAVDRLSLKLEPGDVYGFIGPNGSGKTTTMRMLATLLNPSWGEATVCGHSIYTGSKEIRRAIGYMPDAFGVYDDMKVGEYLEFFAAAYRIQGEARKKKVQQVLEYVDLVYKRDALVTSLSRGMTQRLGLARTLLHDPQVLLLDEPASGLDPRARIEMRELIKRLRRESKTIMLSSHILPELADICNKLGIIERGKLLFNGTVAEAEEQVRKVRGGYIFLASVGDRNQEAAKKLAAGSEVASATVDTKLGVVRVALKPGYDDGSFIPERLIADGFKLRAFEEEKIDIEDVFLTITKGITS